MQSKVTNNVVVNLGTPADVKRPPDPTDPPCTARKGGGHCGDPSDDGRDISNLDMEQMEVVLETPMDK